MIFGKNDNLKKIRVLLRWIWRADVITVSCSVFMLPRRLRKQHKYVYCLFKSCQYSLLANLSLSVIFCNKMAVAPESRVLTFSVFKWSSYSSTYLPEWVSFPSSGPAYALGFAVEGGLLSSRRTCVSSTLRDWPSLSASKLALATVWGVWFGIFSRPIMIMLFFR